MRSLLPWRRQEENEWQPFRELEEWHRSVDDLFSRFMARGPFAGTTFGGKGSPTMERLTKNGNLVVRLDLPGVDPKEVDVSVSGDVLTVKAERKQKEEKKQEGHSHEEIAYGSLERSLRLPGGIDADKIKASYDKGGFRDHHARSEGARPEEGLGQGREQKVVHLSSGRSS
jgi:HSP20 family protein